MSRTFYSYAIFFTALTILVMLSQSIMYLLIGSRITELAGSRGWIFTLFGVIIINSLILIRYYYFKNYRFALWAMAASIAGWFIQSIAIAKFLQTREVTPLYGISILLVIITGIVYGISLLFSRANERNWLRIAGVCSLAAGFVLMSELIWALISIGDRMNGTIEKIDQWASFLNSFIPIFFILNFMNEKSATRDRSRDESWGTLYGIGALVVMMIVPIFGIRFINEGLWRYRHPDFVWDGAKKLASPFDEGSYVNGNDTIRYRLMFPMNYDSTKTYPVVVCLHGSSGCGNDNTKQIASCIPAAWLSQEDNRLKYPAFLFVPQCPLYMAWGGIENVPSVDALVIQSLLTLEKELPIDTTRRYVSGNSLGGYGTWHLISKYPHIFAAAIPISGGGNPALADKLKDIPVWAFHGTADLNVPVQETQAVIEAIKQAGGNPIYSEFPGKAHNIEREVLTTPGLLDWLFAQRRR